MGRVRPTGTPFLRCPVGMPGEHASSSITPANCTRRPGYRPDTFTKTIITSNPPHKDGQDSEPRLLPDKRPAVFRQAEPAAVQFWAVPAAIRSIHAHIPVCKARTLAENDNGNSLLAIFLLQVKRRVLFHPSWRMRQRLHHRYRPWKIRTQLAKEVMGGVKRSFKCRDACLFQVFQPPVRNFLQHNIHPLRPP